MGEHKWPIGTVVDDPEGYLWWCDGVPQRCWAPAVSKPDQAEPEGRRYGCKHTGQVAHRSVWRIIGAWEIDRPSLSMGNQTEETG